MQSKIRDAALSLGYVEAKPATGHPFDVWRNRLSSIPHGQYMSFEHDPVKISGWPLDEITIWAAIAPTPPLAGWPEDCGEIGGFYMCAKRRYARRVAWEDAAIALGYELVRDAFLPERAAAIRAGLGVHALNGLMIAPDYGTFVDITVLLLHAAPPPDARGPEHDLSAGCGDCGKCIKACPTGAISENGMDALICLRNYMNRPEYMPEGDYDKMGKRIIGCETCQIACPYNDALERGRPPADIAECMKFEKLLSNPDMGRISKYVDLNENRVKMQAALAAANTGRKDLLPLIEALTGAGDKALSKIAHWAAGRLKAN
jgi:epoxyqueuosine reductase